MTLPTAPGPAGQGPAGPDWLERPGIVLFVERYAECVAFYRDALGLPLLKDQGDVTILGFGAAYLMIETAPGIGRAAKSRAENPTVLRFNVADVDQVAARLRDHGVEIAVAHHDWGTIAPFRDPDGTLCELRNHFDGFFAPKR